MPQAKKAPAISDETKRKHTIRNPVRTDGEMQVSSQELGYLEEGNLEPKVENHAALLTDPRLSHPANARQKARIVNQLQQHYGNTHVQKVVKRLQASAQSEPEEESLEKTVQNLQQQKGSGHPIEGETRKAMEQSLGYDFGQVRVHTDAAAHKAAGELNAKAFTMGTDVFLSQKQSGNLSSSEGRGLLAHELTHVVQQSQGNLTLPGSKVKMGQVGDLYEREADVIAEEVVRGEQRIQRQAEEEEEQMLQAKAATEGVQRQAEAEEQEETLEGIAGKKKNETSLKSGKNDTNIIVPSPDIQLIDELILESPPDQHTALLTDPRLSLPTNTEQKALVLNQLQRNFGNAHVQRIVAPRPAQVSPSPGIIQLQGGGPAKEVKVFAGKNVLPKPIPCPVIPIRLQQIMLSGEVSVLVVEKGDTESAKVSMGPTHLGGEIDKVWAETENEFGKATLQTKGDIQVTKDGADAGITIGGLKSGNIATELKIVVVKADWKTGKIDIGEIHLSAADTKMKIERTMPDGTKITFQVTRKVTFEFDVDVKKVARWLARAFSKYASAELALTGAFVMGGVLTLAAAAANVVEAGEIKEAVNKAELWTKDFCTAFAGTVQGTDWSVSTEFGFEGEVAARGFLQSAESPPEALREEAKKMGLYAKAFNIAWPTVTGKLLGSWSGSESGRRTLERTLGAVGEHYRGWRSPIATWD